MKNPKTLITQKINKQIYEVRLKTAYKKASLNELLINMKCLQAEINKRMAKKGKK